VSGSFIGEASLWKDNDVHSFIGWIIQITKINIQKQPGWFAKKKKFLIFDKSTLLVSLENLFPNN